MPYYEIRLWCPYCQRNGSTDAYNINDYPDFFWVGCALCKAKLFMKKPLQPGAYHAVTAYAPGGLSAVLTWIQ